MSKALIQRVAQEAGISEDQARKAVLALQGISDETLAAISSHFSFRYESVLDAASSEDVKRSPLRVAWERIVTGMASDA